MLNVLVSWDRAESQTEGEKRNRARLFKTNDVVIKVSLKFQM